MVWRYFSLSCVFLFATFLQSCNAFVRSFVKIRPLKSHFDSCEINSWEREVKDQYLTYSCDYTYRPKQSFLTVLHERKSNLELGIQTAQLLMDPKRYDLLKERLSKQFPFVPESVLDKAVTVAGQAFQQLAPHELREVLKPGGIDRIRPDIEKSLVDFAMNQKVIKDIPVISQKDKRELVEKIMDLALDKILEDATDILAAPEVQLAKLEEQAAIIKQMMGRRQLFFYRLRTANKISLAASALVFSGFIYTQRETVIISKTIKISALIGKHIWWSLKAAGKQLVALKARFV